MKSGGVSGHRQATDGSILFQSGSYLISVDYRDAMPPCWPPDHKAPAARPKWPKLGVLGSNLLAYSTLQAADDPVDPFRERGASEMTCIGSCSTCTYGDRSSPLLLSSPVCFVPVPSRPCWRSYGGGYHGVFPHDPRPIPGDRKRCISPVHRQNPETEILRFVADGSPRTSVLRRSQISAGVCPTHLVSFDCCSVLSIMSLGPVW